jgi:NAD(P)-dependent dehydrogenase (short-subunit alcohol dehydrogenase family)
MTISPDFLRNPLSLFDIRGKSAIVTGASGAFGALAVQVLAGAGAKIAAVAGNAKALEETVTAAKALGAEVLAISARPNSEAACDDIVAQTVKAFGGVDILVVASGKNDVAKIVDMTPERFLDVMDANVTQSWLMARATGRQMLAQGRGVIVNVSSSSGIQYIEGRVAYSTPKAGLIMLTQALGIEWARRGVRVVGIAPGAVMTEMMAEGLRQGIGKLEAYERRTPMRRLGTVEEIAEAVFWLASDEAAYVVAETLRVDGGWTAYQMF